MSKNTDKVNVSNTPNTNQTEPLAKPTNPTIKDTIKLTIENNLNQYPPVELTGNFMLTMMFNLDKNGFVTPNNGGIVSLMPTYFSKLNQEVFNNLMYSNNSDKLFNIVIAGLFQYFISISNNADIPLCELIDTFVNKTLQSKNIVLSSTSSTTPS